MSQINFGLLDTEAPGRIAMSYGEGVKNALNVKAEKQKQQANALQLERVRREGEAEDAVKNALAGGDVNAAAQTLLKGGYYKQAQELQTHAQNQRKAQIDEATKKLDIVKRSAESIFSNPSIENAAAIFDEVEGMFGPGSLKAERAELAQIGNDPVRLKEWAKTHAFSAADMMSKIKYEDTGPALSPVETNPLAPGYNPQPIQKGLSPAEQARVDKGEAGGTPYFTPVQSGHGVYAFNNRTGRMELIQGATGTPIIGSASDPALQGKIAGAKEAGKVEGEAGAKARTDLPAVVAEADQTAKLVDDLLAHPGLGAAVGSSAMLGTQIIPGTQGKDFMVRLEQLKGKQFLQAFQGLKGGGQITEAEGQKATDAMSRMKNTSSEPEFIKAAQEFKDIIRKGADRARAKAGVVPSQSAQTGNTVEIKFVGFE